MEKIKIENQNFIEQLKTSIERLFAYVSNPYANADDEMKEHIISELTNSSVILYGENSSETEDTILNNIRNIYLKSSDKAISFGKNSIDEMIIGYNIDEYSFIIKRKSLSIYKNFLIIDNAEIITFDDKIYETLDLLRNKENILCYFTYGDYDVLIKASKID